MIRSRLRRFPALLAAAALAAMPLAAGAQQADDAVSIGPNYAAQLSQLGQNWLRIGARNKANYEVAAAMLRGAEKADPREPRYPRMLAEAMHALDDTDGEIQAWNAYRNLVPEDRAAEAKVIELYVSQMQSNDQRIKYLQSLVGNAKFPVEIRAHAAALAEPLLAQRSDADAADILASGLSLYPLPELLQLQYTLVTSKEDTQHRVAGLLQLLRANPLQPSVAESLAKELAVAGMPEESASWFATALNLSQRMGVRNDASFYFNLALELYLSNQRDLARQWASKILDSDSSYIPFWDLDLTIARETHDTTDFDDHLMQARQALIRRYSAIAQTILETSHFVDKDPAAIKAAAQPLPLLTRLQTLSDPKLNEEFVLNLEDFCWLELYYHQSPTGAKDFLDVLAKALPADNALLLRMQGWYAAESNDLAAARQALTSSAADGDVLAQLGLIRLDHGKPGTRDRLRDLLNKSPTGLDALFINESLVAEETPSAPDTAPSTLPAVGPAPATATATGTSASASASPTTAPVDLTTDSALADNLRAQLKKFSLGWFSLVDQAARFYTIAAQPVRTTVRFGDPLLATVTIGNRTDEDLVLGFGGAISRSLWFDARVTGISQMDLSAVAFDEIAGPIVLKPHSETTQVVRLDQGPLGQLLLQNANGSMVVSGIVMTNPATFDKEVMPSAGGQFVGFQRSFIRLPSDLQSVMFQRQVRDDFASGSNDDRFHDLLLMASYIVSADKRTSQPDRASADFYIQSLLQARSDASPEIASLAGYFAATLPGVPGKQQTVEQMLAGKDWQSRLLGLAGLRQQPKEVQLRLAKPISSADADPNVRLLAQAIVEGAESPTTQPAEPTTQP